MAIYQINYDLNSPGQDYSKLQEAIKSLGPWAKPLKSCWLIDTPLRAKAISDHLRQFMDANDDLLVTSVGYDYAGFLKKDDVRAWISSRMPLAA
jgi:hypothetical protein